MLFGDDDLRLATVLYAPTPEAEATAAVLLQRLDGELADSEANPVDTQSANPGPGGASKEEKQKPSQPALPKSRVIAINPPSWMKDEPKWQRILEARNSENKTGPKSKHHYKGEVCHESVKELLPSRLGNLEEAEKKVSEALTKVNKSEGAGNAVLVVGHQPQLGRLSSLFVQRKFGLIERAVPIDSSEIVCLRLKKRGVAPEEDGAAPEEEEAAPEEEERADVEWRGRLIWSLAAYDGEALSQVADKVKGKMESAKLLSAVIGLVLTALLGVLLDVDRWNALGSKTNPVQASLPGWTYNGQTAARIAFAMLLAAGALYMLTMYAYDRLLMPTRFWAEGREQAFQAMASSKRQAKPAASSEQEPSKDPRGPRIRRWLRDTRRRWLPRRPPSSSAYVVYRNMQRIWFWLFTPANILVAVALMVLAAALLRIQRDDWATAAVAFILVAGWWWWFRPILGSED